MYSEMLELNWISYTAEGLNRATLEIARNSADCTLFFHLHQIMKGDNQFDSEIEHLWLSKNKETSETRAMANLARGFWEIDSTDS